MEEEEPQPIIVPLRYAPWFRERNIGFEILKEIHGNYVKWKKHSIEEDVDMHTLMSNSRSAVRNQLLLFICKSIEDIGSIGLEPASQEGRNKILAILHNLQSAETPIFLEFKVTINPFSFYDSRN
ncbi:unnamed protein product [Caenorhabditis nigoni]